MRVRLLVLVTSKKQIKRVDPSFWGSIDGAVIAEQWSVEKRNILVKHGYIDIPGTLMWRL